MAAKTYKVVDGTWYDVRTSDRLIDTLEALRVNQIRVVLDYGNVETGESWGEVYDITGRIGRSTGDIKIPLLIHNSRSTGGGAILDHCIIGIKTSKGKHPLYSI
jgi:hypothetical protein